MKKFLSLLVVFPLATFSQGGNVNAPGLTECVSGTIDSLQYDSDDSLSILIDNLNLYTSRTHSYPLLVKALADRMNVVIYSDSCHNGGGFSKFKIYPVKN